MRTLGAVLAGGRSSRFGSDKAEALLHGRTLLAHALAAIERQCDSVVVVGRKTALADDVADWPAADRGPLGGLAGVLRHAVQGGYDQVLSVPVDCVAISSSIIERLAPAPACLVGQPVIGLWPVSALSILEHILQLDRDRSMRAFATAIDARFVAGDFAVPNINRREDLARLTW